jgi:hypothetical protein
MDFDRLPRQLLVSWMPEPRLSNYPQTHSRTALKASKSVGIPEADWPELAENETEWNACIRQTAEERTQLYQDHDVTPFKVLAAIRETRQQPSAALVRRIEFALCGCHFPVPTTGRCAFPGRLEDARRLRLENCFDPDRDRAQHASESPESLNAQLVLVVRKGGNAKVRNSMSGLRCCRKAWRAERPTHRFSWMNPAHDEDYDRDPATFISSSTGPSVPAPIPHCHLPTYFKHCTESQREAATPPCNHPRLLTPTNSEMVGYLIDQIPHDPNSSDPLGLPEILLALPTGTSASVIALPTVPSATAYPTSNESLCRSVPDHL